SQADGRGVMSVWDVKTKRLFWARLVEHDLASLAMSPNNETLAIGTFNSDVKIIVTKMAMLRVPWRSDAKATTAVAFSPDGKMLAIGSDGRAIRLWDMETRSVPVTFRENWGHYYSPNCSDNQRRKNLGHRHRERNPHMEP